MLLQPLQLGLLVARGLAPVVPGLDGADVSLDGLDLLLHGAAAGADSVGGPYEAAREAGEAVAGVKNQEEDADDVESVQDEQQEVLAFVGLQLVEKPFNLLPLRAVWRRRAVEWKKDSGGDEEDEYEY